MRQEGLDQVSQRCPGRPLRLQRAGRSFAFCPVVQVNGLRLLSGRSSLDYRSLSRSARPAWFSDCYRLKMHGDVNDAPPMHYTRMLNLPFGNLKRLLAAADAEYPDVLAPRREARQCFHKCCHRGVVCPNATVEVGIATLRGMAQSTSVRRTLPPPPSSSARLPSRV